MGKCNAVVGLQWGDEGKARIIDYLTAKSDYVVRFQGGANAGHTVVAEGKKYVFHLVPSGILHEGVRCMVGPGVVLDPWSFRDEVDKLGATINDLTSRLTISAGCHMVLPYHKEMDVIYEELKGDSKLGTTGRGIGPCYSDKSLRHGIKLSTLMDAKHLKKRLETVLPIQNAMLQKLGGRPAIELEDLYKDLLHISEWLRPFVGDVPEIINHAITEGKSVLFEGAQSVMLDIDYGTYPFVTSSNSSLTGLYAGCGVNPGKIEDVWGITKAYCTRVGEGPFPSELEGEEAERLREAGGEFGATTGRPRRCGWLDIPAVRYAIEVSGITRLALTKLDVLTGFETIKICIRYENNDHRVFHTNPQEADNLQPVYIELPGWTETLDDIRNFEDLPKNAQDLVKMVERLTGTPIKIITTGASREQTILL